MHINDAALHYTRLDLEEARQDLAAAESDEDHQLALSAVAHYTRKLETLTPKDT